MCVEDGCAVGNGMLRDGGPLLWIGVVGRHHVVQILIKVCGRFLVGLVFVVTNRPTVHAVLAGLPPPSVQNTHVDAAVEANLHAARTARLPGSARRVEPHIGALGHELGQPDAVIGDEHKAQLLLVLFSRVDDLLDELLSRFILRMGLSGEDKLYAVEGEVKEILEVREDERGSFVGGGSPGEGDGKQLIGEAGPRNGVDVADELFWRLAWLLDRFIGYAVCSVQGLRLLPPIGDVSRRRGPGIQGRSSSNGEPRW